MKKINFPARLHVLLARNAPVALVIRRGPAKSVCTIAWDLNRNQFKLGQWLRGRIYERRCDLSPDGKHFIYFAMNGRWKSEAAGSWTAISRVPYLKAITLYPQGDCWYGGGLFLSDQEFWSGQGSIACALTESDQLRRNDKCSLPDYSSGNTVYFNRLQRDGWKMYKTQSYPGEVLFEKQLPEHWSLRKFAFSESNQPPGKGCDWDAHELRHGPSGTILAFPEWEWADHVNDRLVWAVDGQLRAARLGNGKLLGEKLLQDFNEMKFEALVAPY